MKLIIINGPCGIGKSTLAARLHADINLSFLLDIDAQRRYINRYREQREASGKIVQAVSMAIIKSCLESGCDVIIDKMTFDPEVLDYYYEIAKTYGADVYEIVLWAPKEVVMKRADERGWREGGMTPEQCDNFWHKIDELKEFRPQAHIIDTENVEGDVLYEQVIEIVNRKN